MTSTTLPTESLQELLAVYLVLYLCVLFHFIRINNANCSNTGFITFWYCSWIASWNGLMNKSTSSHLTKDHGKCLEYWLQQLSIIFIHTSPEELYAGGITNRCLVPPLHVQFPIGGNWGSQRGFYLLNNPLEVWRLLIPLLETSCSRER